MTTPNPLTGGLADAIGPYMVVRPNIQILPFIKIYLSYLFVIDMCLNL